MENCESGIVVFAWSDTLNYAYSPFKLSYNYFNKQIFWNFLFFSFAIFMIKLKALTIIQQVDFFICLFFAFCIYVFCILIVSVFLV